MRCANCGSTILFGGVSRAGRQYCKQACLKADRVGALIDAVPVETAMKLAVELRNGGCPECRASKPVEHWMGHRCMSFLIMTRWSSHAYLCCASCGKKKIAGDLALTLVLGWWGFPWGFVVTPIQVIRNVAGLFRGSGGGGPSQELVLVAKRLIASKAAEGSRSSQPHA